MVIRNPGGAGIGVESFRKRVAQREHAAAGPVLGLKDGYIMSRLSQLVAGGQPRQPRSDDDDLLRADATSQSVKQGRIDRSSGECRCGNRGLLQELSAVHRPISALW